MLVLNRKKDETIRIGENSVIRTCQLKGSTVQVGIEAPESVSIKRGELPNWIGILDVPTPSSNHQSTITKAQCATGH